MSHNINVDFEVRSTLTKLIVTDLSDWKHIEDKPSIIEITLPGSKTPVVKYFDKYKVNKYNSFDLEINCYDECASQQELSLPDGMYKIVIKGSPSSFYKEYMYMKTDKFDAELAKLTVLAHNKPHKEAYIKKLLDMYMLKVTAEAHVKTDDISVATELFQKAIETVEKLKNCDNCHVWMQ